MNIDIRYVTKVQNRHYVDIVITEIQKGKK